jgi:hypothetical protein
VGFAWLSGKKVILIDGDLEGPTFIPYGCAILVTLGFLLKKEPEDTIIQTQVEGTSDLYADDIWARPTPPIPRKSGC